MDGLYIRCKRSSQTVTWIVAISDNVNMNKIYSMYNNDIRDRQGIQSGVEQQDKINGVLGESRESGHCRLC